MKNEEQEIRKIRKEYDALLQEALNRERRKFVRVNESVPVLLKGKEEQGYFFSMDVGLGGIRFTWSEALAIGERFQLSIALDKIKTWIHVEGEVIWQRPYDGKFEIGMVFTAAAADEKDNLNHYLQEVSLGLNMSGDADEDTRLQEKRNHPRVSRLFLSIIEFPGAEAEKSPGLILDISLGGARLLSGRQIPEETRIRLNVEMEGSDAIHLDGKVVWTNRVEALKKFQHGIEFLHAVQFGDYSSEIKRMLETYIHYQNALKELNLVETLLKIIRKK